MQSRYKIVISSRNIYKEVELAGNIDEIKVGTGADCGVRLRKELFFENIEISFIRREETWSIICSDNIYFTVGDLRKLITKQLEHGDELVFKYQNSNSVIFNVSFALDFDYEKKAYDLAIDLKDVKRLAVGGEAHCQVILRSPYVGKDGFIIEKENNNYYLRKGNSKYGIYLNGRRNDEDALLKENDFISLANFSFCFLKGKLYTTRNVFMEITGLKVYEVCESRSEHVYPKFNRSTRLKSVVSTEKIPVKDPSAAPSKPKGNIVMQLFPALAMLAVTVVVRGMMSSSSNSSFILLSVCTMSIGIISSVVGIVNERKEYKKDTKERIEKYNKYIAETEAEIQKMRIEEAAILEDTYFSTDKEIRMVDDFSANLFDRSQEDIDYLEIRLGTGKNEALRQVDFKVQEKYDCEDELVQLPAEIAEKYQYIENTPSVSSEYGSVVASNNVVTQEFSMYTAHAEASSMVIDYTKAASITPSRTIEAFQKASTTPTLENTLKAAQAGFKFAGDGTNYLKASDENRTEIIIQNAVKTNHVASQLDKYVLKVDVSKDDNKFYVGGDGTKKVSTLWKSITEPAA